MADVEIRHEDPIVEEPEHVEPPEGNFPDSQSELNGDHEAADTVDTLTVEPPANSTPEIHLQVSSTMEPDHAPVHEADQPVPEIASPSPVASPKATKTVPTSPTKPKAKTTISVKPTSKTASAPTTPTVKKVRSYL